MPKGYCTNFRVEQHEQNSVLKRKYQHPLNVAQARFIQSHVPIKFWRECILTAAYLINKAPTPVTWDTLPKSL